MSNPWLIVGVAAGSYLLGSVSPSVFLGRLVKHVDLRRHGSGNPGTTNAFRVLGVKLGIVVLVCDILKGLLPILVCRWLGFGPLASVGAGLAAIVGHNWSIFLRGKGGKGIATTAGVIIGLMPIISGIVVLSFAVMILITRYISVGSLFATLVFVAATLIGRQPWPYIVCSSCAAVMIFYAHRGNLKRLFKRQEPRLVLPWKKKKSAAKTAGNSNSAKVVSKQAKPNAHKHAPRKAPKRVAPRGSG